MTRPLFGATGADLFAQVTDDDGDFGPVASAYDAFEEFECVTPVTDLLTFGGVAAEQVTPIDADDPNEFRMLCYAPDEYSGALYLRDSENPAAAPYLVLPVNIVDRVQELETAVAAFEGGYNPPVGGIPESDLDAATQGKIDGAVQKSIVDAEGDLLVGTADNTVGRLAKGSAGQYVRRNAAGTALEYGSLPDPPAPPDVSRFMTKDTAGGGLNGSIRQAADVSDVPLFDKASYVFDDSAGLLVPRDLSTQFAAADPSTSRLSLAAYGKYQRDVVVVNQGDPPPSDIQLGTIGFSRPGAPSLVPILLDSDSVRAANNVVVSSPEDLATTDFVGVTVCWSNETGLDHFSIAFGTGAATIDFGTLSIPNTTAGCLNAILDISTLVPAGATITITARNAANAAINRAHIIVFLYRLPNIATSSARDKEQVNGGTSVSNLAAISAGPTSSLSQPNELGLGAGCWTSLPAPGDRGPLGGTNGWLELAHLKSDNGTSARTGALFYKLLAAAAPVTFTTSLASSDNQTGTWAAKLDTVKAA